MTSTIARAYERSGRLPHHGELLSRYGSATANAVSRWIDRDKVALQPELRAVVFDVGGVIVDFNFMTAVNKICGNEVWTDGDMIERVETCLKAPELKGPFERGQIDMELFYGEVNGRLSFQNTNLDQFTDFWNGVFTLKPDTEAMAARIRKASLLTVLLSDTSLPHFKYLKGFSPTVGIADERILSWETGVFKSDEPGAFEKLMLLMTDYKIPLGSCLFLDDNIGNVDLALGRGIPSMQFLNATDAEAVIENVWGDISVR